LTKYKIIDPSTTKSRKRKRPSKNDEKPISETDTKDASSTGPRAELSLKTFCPESGVCLKYKTDQAAEVGRLVRSLGHLARGMAGLEMLADGTFCDSYPDLYIAGSRLAGLEGQWRLT
jgi:hypothetical protein